MEILDPMASLLLVGSATGTCCEQPRVFVPAQPLLSRPGDHPSSCPANSSGQRPDSALPVAYKAPFSPCLRYAGTCGPCVPTHACVLPIRLAPGDPCLVCFAGLAALTVRLHLALPVEVVLCVWLKP